MKNDVASETELNKNVGGNQADTNYVADSSELLSDLSDMGALAISSSTSIIPQQKMEMEPLLEHVVENVKEIMKESAPKDISQSTVQQDQYHVDTKNTATSMEIDSCSEFDLNVGGTDIVFSPLSEYTNSSDSEVSSMKYITGMDYEVSSCCMIIYIFINDIYKIDVRATTSANYSKYYHNNRECIATALS